MYGRAKGTETISKWVVGTKASCKASVIKMGGMSARMKTQIDGTEPWAQKIRGSFVFSHEGGNLPEGTLPVDMERMGYTKNQLS